MLSSLFSVLVTVSLQSVETAGRVEQSPIGPIDRPRFTLDGSRVSTSRNSRHMKLLDDCGPVTSTRTSMTHRAEIEFVCYEEGGIIDLFRALDDLLPQTLVKLPPDDESFRDSRAMSPAAVGPFQPSVRPVPLHHAREDLLARPLRNLLLPETPGPGRTGTQSLAPVPALCPR